MIVIYPINGRNERMGSLFSTPKHLLLLEGKSVLSRSIDAINQTFNTPQIIIITNIGYLAQLEDFAKQRSNVHVELINQTSSHVETLRSITTGLKGSVMFVDCDIVPLQLTSFDETYPTVFTFKNELKLPNYSNFKANQNKIVVDCNEKQKLYSNAGAGIYYFPNIHIFNQYSEKHSSVSQCIKAMLLDGVKTKLNTDSTIGRYGTLQDLYVDNFSFRQPKTKDLSTGFTNNCVYKVNRKVVKVGSTVSDELAWYEAYKDKKHIPKILASENDRIEMEYIKRDADINLDDIFEIIETYKKYPVLNQLGFNTYIQNIERHLINNPAITNGQFLLKCLNSLTIPSTFCHGDLSIMNVIPTKHGLRLIDPLYSKNKYGSFQLDIAKLCFSFKFYKNDSASFSYVKSKANLDHLEVLVAAEAVRVSSYKRQYSFVAENLIKELVYSL